MHLQEDMHLLLGINSTFQYLCRCLIYSVPHPVLTIAPDKKLTNEDS